MTEFRKKMAELAADVEEMMGRLIPAVDDAEARVVDAMRYSILAGGKRLRPFLAIAFADLYNVSRHSSLRVAAAIEMVHTYSLVHDDLPAMDDDDLRRGVPTCHVKYDEATAILAGDALQTRAFEILAEPETHPDPNVRCLLIRILAQAIGAHGMVGGQMIDLEAEQKTLKIDEITRLQHLKTGALIIASCEMGAVLGHADENARRFIRFYGQDLGLAFQIADDILDNEADTATLGKTAGKDLKQGKATFVSLLGLEGAKERANMLVDQAIGHLNHFDERADLLREAAKFVVTRQN